MHIYYKFDGKKLSMKAKKTGEYNDENESCSYGPYIYEVNGKKASASKYKMYVSRLKKGAKKEKLKLYDITQANLDKYL